LEKTIPLNLTRGQQTYPPLSPKTIVTHNKQSDSYFKLLKHLFYSNTKTPQKLCILTFFQTPHLRSSITTNASTTLSEYYPGLSYRIIYNNNVTLYPHETTNPHACMPFYASNFFFLVTYQNSSSLQNRKKITNTQSTTPLPTQTQTHPTRPTSQTHPRKQKQSLQQPQSVDFFFFFPILLICPARFITYLKPSKTIPTRPPKKKTDVWNHKEKQTFAIERTWYIELSIFNLTSKQLVRKRHRMLLKTPVRNTHN
jgi:hypothetical protein